MKNNVSVICISLAVLLVISVTLTLAIYYTAHEDKLIGDNICPPIDMLDSIGMTHVVDMAFAGNDAVYALGFRTTDIYDPGKMMLASVNINLQECTLLDTWEGPTSYDLQVNVFDDNTHLVLAGNRLYKTEAGLTSLEDIFENMVTIENEVHLPSNNMAAVSQEPETYGDIYLKDLTTGEQRTLVEAKRDDPYQFYTDLSFSADGQYLLFQSCRANAYFVNSVLCYSVDGELQLEIKSPPVFSDSISLFWIDNSPGMFQGTDRSEKTKTGRYSELTVWNIDGSTRHMLTLDKTLHHPPEATGSVLSKCFCITFEADNNAITALDFVSGRVIGEHKGTAYKQCLAVSDDRSMLCYVEKSKLYLKEILPD